MSGGHDDHHAAPSGGGGGGGGGEGLGLKGPAQGLAGVAAATGVTVVWGLFSGLVNAIFRS